MKQREIKFRIYNRKAKSFIGWADFCKFGTEQDGIFDLNSNKIDELILNK